MEENWEVMPSLFRTTRTNGVKVNKNILIEEADKHLRLITQAELKEIEDSAEEFDGFTGIRIVGQLQNKTEIIKAKIGENMKWEIICGDRHKNGYELAITKLEITNRIKELEKELK